MLLVQSTESYQMLLVPESYRTVRRGLARRARYCTVRYRTLTYRGWVADSGPRAGRPGKPGRPSQGRPNLALALSGTGGGRALKGEDNGTLGRYRYEYGTGNLVDFSFIVSLYVSDLPNVTISTVPVPQHRQCHARGTSSSAVAAAPRRSRGTCRGSLWPVRTQKHIFETIY